MVSQEIANLSNEQNRYAGPIPAICAKILFQVCVRKLVAD